MINVGARVTLLEQLLRANITAQTAMLGMLEKSVDEFTYYVALEQWANAHRCAFDMFDGFSTKSVLASMGSQAEQVITGMYILLDSSPPILEAYATAQTQLKRPQNFS